MKARVIEYLASLPPRALWLAMGGILSLVLLEGWLLVLRQPFGEYQQLKRDHASLEAIASAPQELPAEIERVERQLGILDQRLAGANAQIAPERTIVQLVDRLAALAARHGATLDGVRPAEARRVLVFDEMAFNIQATGTYPALMKWLEDIERELAPLAVAQFSIKRGAEGRGLTMELRMVAYRLRAPDGRAT